MPETVQQQLESTIQYPVALDAINALATEYMPLTIDGINDKEGQALVKAARIDVKKHRVAVEHKRKSLKADALEYGRKVDSAAKILTGELTKIEDHLKAEEAAVQEEIDRIVQELEEKRQAELQTRLNKLAAVNCMMVTATVEMMTDEQFAERLAEATKQHEEKKAGEADRQRQAEEAEKKRKAEEERLAADRKKLEEERAALEAEKQKVEAERLAADRKVAEEKRQKEEAEAEKERQEVEAKAEKERLKRIEIMRPDLEKLARVADAVEAINVPAVREVAQPKREKVVAVLEMAVARIREITNQE